MCRTHLLCGVVWEDYRVSQVGKCVEGVRRLWYTSNMRSNSEDIAMTLGVDAPATSITLDDFITGLIAGLAAEGVSAISIRDTDFYAAVDAAFRRLESISDEHGLRLKFWITLNRVYGDSADVRVGITRAVQRDLVSLDNPVYVNMRLRVDQNDSESYLRQLPGGPAVFREVTQAFLEHYSNEPNPT